jgi:hypothetical protein
VNLAHGELFGRARWPRVLMAGIPYAPSSVAVAGAFVVGILNTSSSLG